MHFGQGVEGRPRLPQNPLISSLAAAFLAVSTLALGQQQSLPEDYRFATLMYKQQRWDQAAKAFRDFVKQNPTHERVPYARLYLGLALVNGDHLSDARQVLRDYVRDYPQSKNRPDVVYRVGECSYLLDDLKSAETEFQQFLDQYPQHELAEWALPYLADTKLRLKQPEAARDLYKKAQEKYPQSRLAEDVKFGLARADEELNDLDAAAALYSQIAESKTNGTHAAQSLMNLATIRFRTGKYEDAAKDFRQLIAGFPKSRLLGAAQLNAGLSLYQLGQYQQAIELFDKAAVDTKQAAAAGYWKGISLKALGDIPQAIKVLKATYEADPKSSVAESTLFYWADCELRAAHYAPAQKLFLELAEKWSQVHDDLVRDSLHFAAEAALLGGSLDQAEQLVARFDKEFPNSKIALSEEILLARILDAKAAALLKQTTDANREQRREEASKLRETAIQHLEKVLAASQLARTKTLASYHLGRILQQAGEHARVVEILGPIVEQAERATASGAASSEAIESLVIWAKSQGELGNQQAAVTAYSSYLKLRPKGPQAQQALAERTLSNGRLGKKQDARDDALLLIKEYPQDAVGADTLRRLAERAYDAKDWGDAGELFKTLAAQGSPDTELRRIGLSGLGWARYETARQQNPSAAEKTLEESAAAFAQVFEKFPVRVPQVAEAGYMQGLALQTAGKKAEAGKAFAETFQKVSKLSLDQDASKSAANIRQYGFMAGVQAANVLAQLGKFDEADAAYRAAIDRFPKELQVGQALFDWANMLYVAKKDAEQRTRVREIVSRILRDHPGSAVSDKARLFLAELDLVEGKSGDAEKVFREVLADPKADRKVREDGLSRLIAVAADKEEWTSVQQLAEKYLTQFSKGPDAALVRLNLAAAQLGLKQPAVAEKTLTDLKSQFAETAGDLPQWAARIWVLLAEAEYQQKKYADVENTADDLRKRMPKSPLFYQIEEILGRSYKNLAQWEKAIAAFQQVIDERAGAEDVTSAKSRFLIAECWFLQKKYNQARTDYLKVLTYNKPEWAAPALFQAGLCAEALKERDDAEKSYHSVISDYPQSEFATEAKKRLDELHKKATG
jgi:cellulose synthase operon protein C